MKSCQSKTCCLPDNQTNSDWHCLSKISNLGAYSLVSKKAKAVGFGERGRMSFNAPWIESELFTRDARVSSNLVKKSSESGYSSVVGRHTRQ